VSRWCVGAGGRLRWPVCLLWQLVMPRTGSLYGALTDLHPSLLSGGVVVVVGGCVRYVQGVVVVGGVVLGKCLCLIW
jgi:hypothetical protein